MMEELLLAMAPSEQVTAADAVEQEPWEGEIRDIVKCVGRFTVRATPVAPRGPLLATVTV
jgi:hypothetical protein